MGLILVSGSLGSLGFSPSIDQVEDQIKGKIPTPTLSLPITSWDAVNKVVADRKQYEESEFEKQKQTSPEYQQTVAGMMVRFGAAFGGLAMMMIGVFSSRHPERFSL